MIPIRNCCTSARYYADGQVTQVEERSTIVGQRQNKCGYIIQCNYAYGSNCKTINYTDTKLWRSNGILKNPMTYNSV